MALFRLRVLALASGLLGAVAHAQAPDPEVPEPALEEPAGPTDFDLGVRALDAGEAEVAEGHFRAAMATRPDDRTALNLAEAVLRQGRPREALTIVRPLATSVEDPIVLDVARDLEARARAQVATVRVRWETGAAVGELRVDGQVVEPLLRLELDPGAHHVEAVGPEGDVVDERHVTLEPGTSQTLVLGRAREAVLIVPRDVRRRRRIRIGVVTAAVATVALTGVVVALATRGGGTSSDVPPVRLGGRR